MKQMLIALGFPKPPEGITPFQLFSKVETKVIQKSLVRKKMEILFSGLEHESPCH